MTGRSGFALVATLLLVAAFAALGAGIMAVGAREAAIAGAAARLALVRAGAEATAAAVVAGWSTRQHADLPVGASAAVPMSPLDQLDRSAALRRLAADLFLVEGEARADAPGGHHAHARAALLLRAWDQHELAEAFAAPASAVASVRVAGGHVSAHGPCPAPGSAPAVMAPEIEILPGSVVSGSPPAALVGPPALPSPHPFDSARAAALADVSLGSGDGTPRPGPGPGCRTGVWDWGAVATGHACHDARPFVHASGPLHARGGEGRALLFVDGDLHLDGTTFHGAIVATGRVILDGGARVRGAVRAHHVDVRDASVTHAPCDVLAALAAGGLDRPFRPGERWWLPSF